MEKKTGITKEDEYRRKYYREEKPSKIPLIVSIITLFAVLGKPILHGMIRLVQLWK